MMEDEFDEIYMETFVSVKDLNRCIDECRKDAEKENWPWEAFVACVRECKRLHAIP